MLAEEEAWPVEQDIIGDELGAREVGVHGDALRGERLLADRYLAVILARQEPVRHLRVEADVPMLACEAWVFPPVSHINLTTIRPPSCVGFLGPLACSGSLGGP